jgi:hypothetical protein
VSAGSGSDADRPRRVVVPVVDAPAPWSGLLLGSGTDSLARYVGYGLGALASGAFKCTAVGKSFCRFRRRLDSFSWMWQPGSGVHCGNWQGILLVKNEKRPYLACLCASVPGNRVTSTQRGGRAALTATTQHAYGGKDRIPACRVCSGNGGEGEGSTADIATQTCRSKTIISTHTLIR